MHNGHVFMFIINLTVTISTLKPMRFDWPRPHLNIQSATDRQHYCTVHFCSLFSEKLSHLYAAELSCNGFLNNWSFSEDACCIHKRCFLAIPLLR